MIENQPTISPTTPYKTKKVSIQERSVHVGDFVVVNGYRVNRTLLKERFEEGGYQSHETKHFLLFTRAEEPKIILVHWFAPEEMNADIKHHVVLELKPLGLLTKSADFGTLFAGIIGSFFPGDAHKAWHGYGAKTLQRFLLYLSTAQIPQKFDYYATIAAFGTWYQRVCELFVGQSFLDAGCESGFLPLIIAERIPFITESVGIDIRPDMFAVARELAEEWNLPTVRFEVADLLHDTCHSLGTFDTVTALGVIEHFSEEEMYTVLTNLLAVTSHRLILTVPYEDEPETLYEHKQLFTREKLEAVGHWCIQQLDGKGKMWCEDCNGGLLLIERLASSQ